MGGAVATFKDTEVLFLVLFSVNLGFLVTGGEFTFNSNIHMVVF